MASNKAFIAALAALALGTGAGAQQVGPLPDIQHGTLAVHLTAVATNLAAPDYAISPPGDLNRLFVVEQRGLLLVVQNGALLATPALDVQSRVAPPLVPGNANDERGLLGLAFHPDFGTAGSPGFGTLYTYESEPIPAGSSPTYAAPNGATQNYRNVVVEWKMSAADPNIVDPATRREIISFGKNAANHNGGTLTFGPDRYLYLALGDGGNANDVGPSHIEPGGNAQNLTTPLGKMLRFDPLNPLLNPGSSDPVSANGQYRIPVTNPFQGPGQVPEVFALGLRNPYRFSFDRLNGQLIQADVGQNNIEEIDRIEIGGNYGWAVKEGDFLFNRSNGTIGARSPGAPAGLIDPLSGPAGTLEYDHSDGISITGGFVYRGSAIPELYGKYVFGDLALRNAPPRVDGRLFYADLATGEILEFNLPQFPENKLPNGLTVHGFGEDGSGELYACVTNTPSNGTGGILYKFGPDTTVSSALEEFNCASEPGGVRLRWRLHEPQAFSVVRIERAGQKSGPFAEIAAERTASDGYDEALDRTAVAGNSYWYRLVAVDRESRLTAFPPIAITAGEAFTSPVLSTVFPNPTRGAIDVEFALPRAGQATVRLLDSRGRVIATLSSGSRGAGRHRLTWDGVVARTPIAAGVYFVELRAAGSVSSQRVVIAR